MALQILQTPEIRVEGRAKVTGDAQYTADIHPPGTLWAAMVRSPHPHARVMRVETARAKRAPGVRAVLTARDIGAIRVGRRLYDYPVLVFERAMFIGDRVAAVAADDYDTAVEAAQLVEVEYEELEAVTDPEAAIREGAPILHPEYGSYLNAAKSLPDLPNLQGAIAWSKGDVERGFEECDHIFEYTFRTTRVHQAYIEPHACLVEMDQSGRVRVWSPNKGPLAFRNQMAHVTGLKPAEIVVETPYIGGDFGGKGASFDEFACYFLARETGRPVKAVMTYAEELLAGNPRHAGVLRLKTGLKADGTLWAHQSVTIFNGGAYGAMKPIPPMIIPGASQTLGPYRIPHTHMQSLVVYTNTVPSGHFRSPGEPQAIFAGESHLDMIAHELGIDPLEFRLKNLADTSDTSPSGERWREVSAREVLLASTRAMEYGHPLPEGHGLGLALGFRSIGSGQAQVQLSLFADGSLELLTSQPDQGAGAHTMMQRVIAATLSVSPALIRVAHGNTETAPPDSGAGASRGTHVNGQAAARAALELQRQLKELAAELLGASPGDLTFRESNAVDERSGRSLGWTELAAQAARDSQPLRVAGVYSSAGAEVEDFNFMAQCVEVSVDTETGQARIERAASAVDQGQIINPVAYYGQLDGGLIQALGFAAMESLPDEQGRILAANLGEYKIPTTQDIFPHRAVVVPSGEGPGPFGAKMAGEVTNSLLGAAFANAVEAACGVRITEVPITAERVRKAIGNRQ